jgi:hypothetical protein
VVSIRTPFLKMFLDFNIHFFMRKHKPGVLGGVPLGEGVMEDPVAPIAVLQGDRTLGLQLGGVLPPP